MGFLMKIPVLLLLAACAACSEPMEPGPPLPAGSPAPAVLRGESRTTIAWIIRQEDYLTCRTPAGPLRAVQRRDPSRIQIAVLAIDSDTTYVESFFRQERIDAEISYLSTRAYRRVFSNAEVPALYIVRGDSVEASLSGTATLEEIERFLSGITD